MPSSGRSARLPIPGGRQNERKGKSEEERGRERKERENS